MCVSLAEVATVITNRVRVSLKDDPSIIARVLRQRHTDTKMRADWGKLECALQRRS